MSATSEENRECPLCLEPLEMDDLNFFPCTCGYQICRFCWHRIRTNENGLCPACRKQYSEDPANFKPLTAEELQKIKSEKRQKDLQRKQKISENRKHLANVRVVQKNLVFVVGLPTRLADAEELRKPDYFGRFGKIVKVICNQSTSYAGTQGPSASAYVTYQRSEDALRAIQSVNNSKIDGRTLKASLGTTKYCSNFLKKLQCPKQDCMYLHELGDEAASFTKEDMQAGKHQEYEKKLYDQMIANSNPNRKESLNGDQGKASLRGGGSQRKKRRKQPSPTEPTDSTFFQKERWPSPPKREDHRSNSLSDTQSNSQSSPNNSSPELEPNIVSSEKNICQDGGASLEQFQNKSIDNHLSSPNTSDNPEEYRQTQVQQQPLPPQQQPPPPSLPPQQQIGNRLAMEPKLASVPPNHYNSSSFFQPIDSLSNEAKSSLETHTSMLLPKIPSQKSPPGIFSNVSQQQHMTSSPASSSSHLYSLKAPGFHSASMVNGLSAHTSSQLKNFVSSSSQDWSDGRAREFYKYKMSDMLMNGTAHSIAMSSATTNREDVNSSSSLFISSRNNMVPLNRSPGVQSGHDTVNHLYNGVNTSSRNLKNSYLPSENSSYCNQDDDLGFDPWHESAKGLADLMVKEADEKAKANGLLQNRNSAHFARRTVMPMDSTSIGGHCIENSHLVTRQTAPPPGFSNYGANSMSRPSYGDAFPNKMLPVMSMYNQSSAPHMTQYQQQIMHPSSGSFLNVLHATEAGLRPQAREWHESLTNMQQKNVDINFGNLISQRTPAHMGRVNSTMWNQTTNAPSEMPWVQQEQNLSHGFVENRNVSPNQLEKMLQQLKFNDQAARIQNHFKYSSLSSYRGGSS